MTQTEEHRDNKKWLVMINKKKALSESSYDLLLQGHRTKALTARFDT